MSKNNVDVTDVILEDLKSIRNTKQAEVEWNRKISTAPELQWNIFDDTLQLRRSSCKDAKTPKTKGKILKLIFLYSTKLDYMLTWDHFWKLSVDRAETREMVFVDKVESCEEVKFSKWTEQFAIVAEASIGRRYFREKNWISYACWCFWRHNVFNGLHKHSERRVLRQRSIGDWKNRSALIIHL